MELTSELPIDHYNPLFFTEHESFGPLLGMCMPIENFALSYLQIAKGEGISAPINDALGRLGLIAHDKRLVCYSYLNPDGEMKSFLYVTIIPPPNEVFDPRAYTHRLRRILPEVEGAARLVISLESPT